jgi:TRAP transporter 4TM/12TM fusion protein
MGDSEMAANATASGVDLQGLVAEADTGARKPAGNAGRLIYAVAIAWSLFQVWYASPLPYILGVGIFGDTEARAFHLSFALFLAFAAYPAMKSSPRDRVPAFDWLLAAAGICAVLYLVVFYREIAMRPGLPTQGDIIAAVVGVVLLLEASRRAEGPWMPIIAIVALLYVFLGPHLPGLLAHRGSSVSRAASHFWLTSEGVFGVALGVSTNFIFLFVLFGALLEKAGAGNYFIQLSFALLGKFRGGPAKAAVVSSGLTGTISGSSVANVVTTGTFTIPLMKRVGYSPVKAAAIECAAGVNGQIMPPVMGAAAFLMAEYVGITYAEVVRHAFLPAVLTYGALFYVVDLEAVKAGMKGIERRSKRSLSQGIVKALMTICAIVILGGLVHYGLGWTKTAFGEASGLIATVALVVAYLVLLRVRAKSPDLAADDASSAFATVPDFYEVARTGLHYILPVVVLVWCLMIEEMSPGLAAFWGVMAMGAVVLTQRPGTAFFRGERRLAGHWRDGWREFVDGLVAGARNMTAIGIATATAGILVGTVTLTGIGLVMTEIVETLSAGNIVIMLLLVGIICIILGAGLPTTANYVVVATLMAPVVVELAAENDLAVPLIAVHMFVFYFGLMADVSPPVGLAAYAAAAIANTDPMKVSWQGTWYELRTLLLPFVFIFNPELLLIDIQGPLHLLAVVGCSAVAMMAFAAVLQGYFFAPNRAWETLALLLICFTLFRPQFWMSMIYPPFNTVPASSMADIIGATPEGGALRLSIQTTDIAGDDVIKAVRLKLGPQASVQERLAVPGIGVSGLTSQPVITSVRPGSEAARLKLRPGDRVESLSVANTARPNSFLFAVPAIAALVMLALLQRRRRGGAPVLAAAP